MEKGARSHLLLLAHHPMEQGPFRPEDMAETVQDGELPSYHTVQHDRVQEQIGTRYKQQAKDSAGIMKVGLPWMDFGPR